MLPTDRPTACTNELRMRLQRVFNDGVALGAMCDDAGRLFLPTFENKPIPAGTYTVKLMPAKANPKHGVSWEVQDVPGRTDILFHVGNDADDSDGCILVGFGFAGRTITNSLTAFASFKRFLAKVSTFTLTVADPV